MASTAPAVVGDIKLYLAQDNIVKELSAVPAQLQGASQKLASAVAEEAQLQKLCVRNGEIAEKLHKKEEEEKSGFQMSKLIPISPLKKRQERLENEATRRADEADAKLKKATEMLINAKEGRCQLQRRVAELQQKNSKREAARRARADCVNRLFAGPLNDTEDARLMADFTSVATAVPAYQDVVQRHNLATRNLQTASAKLQSAIKKLQFALALDVGGMAFSNDPGLGMLADVGMIAQTQEAAREVQSSREDIMKAYQLVPMPNIDINQIRGLSLMFVFDFFVLDIIALMKIREAMQSCNQALGSVNSAISWLQFQISTIHGPALARAQADLSAAQSRLDCHRHSRILRAADECQLAS